MTITFDTDGTARCLHSDEIPLHTLGTMTVRRASNVEFNERSQEWEVWPETRLWTQSFFPMFRSPSRAECLAWERDHWEEFA